MKHSFRHISGIPAVLEQYPKLESWLKLNDDNTVTVFTGKVELGQGLKTALAMMVAEELDMPLEHIRMPLVSTDYSPDEGFTAGSASLENSGLALRLVAAQLKASLWQVAAHELKIAKEKLELRDAFVWRVAEPTALGRYADFVAKLNPDEVFSGSVQVKDPKHYKLVGQASKRFDIPAKVRGEAIFLQDLKLPDMLHGRVLRSSFYNARLESLDAPEIEASAGFIKLVKQGGFVGLVCQKEYQAIQAVTRLASKAQWQSKSMPTLASLAKQATLASDTFIVKEGNFKAVDPNDSQLKARYFQPYQAHASVAPSCAIALASEDKLKIWTHSQGIYPLRRELAQLLDLDEAKLELIHVEGPGCYGHNGADDAAADAALLALAVPNRPVRVQWQVAQELQGEPYSPAMMIDLKASLKPEGLVSDWNFEVLSDSHVMRPAGQGGRLRASWELKNHKAKPTGPTEGTYRNAETLYLFANRHISAKFQQGPLRTSALRTLGAYANTFANESFMDELAYAANCDPIAFRLRHLKDKRARAVIETAAQEAAWQPHSQATAEGVGMAFAQYKNTKAYVAQVVKLSIDLETAKLSLKEIITVCDAGQVINHDGLVNQLEGGTLQGLSRCLFEEVKIDPEGNGMQTWEAYKVLGFADVPELTTIVLNQPNEAPLGAGEASTVPMAAAIANALYDATGIRMRSLPLTAENIRASLSSMSEDELNKVILE